MPSAIKIELWCDPCSTEEKWVEGEYTPIMVHGQAKPRRLILCAAHMKEMFTPLHDLLMSPLAEVVDGDKIKATPVRTATPETETLKTGLCYCPIDDCPRHSERPVKGIATVRRHLVTEHDMTRDEARAATNSRRSYRPSVEKVTCEECGESFEFPTFARPGQALGKHVAEAHPTVRKG